MAFEVGGIINNSHEEIDKKTGEVITVIDDFDLIEVSIRDVIELLRDNQI